MAKKGSKRREWTKSDIRELSLWLGVRPQRERLLGPSRGQREQLVRRLLPWEFR